MLSAGAGGVKGQGKIPEGLVGGGVGAVKGSKAEMAFDLGLDGRM